jgi:hypothetical protein
MNEMCDRCGPAVAAVYRVERHGELYLCGHCTNRLWAALFAQGWTIWPASGHALAPQADECSGASWQRTRRGRGSGRSPRMLRCRFGAFVRWCRRAGAGDHGAWPQAANPRKR